MVYFRSCPICIKTVLDQDFHDPCKIAVLEDILLKVQKAIKNGKGDDLPRALRSEIMDLGLRSMPDFLESIKEKSEKKRHFSPEICDSLRKK